MISARIHLTGDAKLQRALARIRQPQLRTVLERSLLKSAFLVQRIAATEKIRMGARRAPPVPDRLTSRNAGAGLVGSIAVDRSQLPFVATVGSALRYAAVHEIGGIVPRPAHRRRTRGGRTVNVRAHTALYPRRPYLQPALKDAAPKFPDLFVAEIDRAVGAEQ